LRPVCRGNVGAWISERRGQRQRNWASWINFLLVIARFYMLRTRRGGGGMYSQAHCVLVGRSCGSCWCQDFQLCIDIFERTESGNRPQSTERRGGKNFRRRCRPACAAAVFLEDPAGRGAAGRFAGKDAQHPPEYFRIAHVWAGLFIAAGEHSHRQTHAAPFSACAVVHFRQCRAHAASLSLREQLSSPLALLGPTGPETNSRAPSGG
jgi:hypothetical protein